MSSTIFLKLCFVFQASHSAKVPEFGHTLHITWFTDKSDTADFTAPTPHPLNLPSIPENVRFSFIILFLGQHNLTKFLIQI